MTSDVGWPSHVRLEVPTVRELVEMAAEDGLELSASEATELHPTVARLVESIRGLQHRLPWQFESPPGRRTSWSWSEADKDPLNAAITFCDIRGETTGPLADRTIGIKDNIDVAGVPTTDGAREHFFIPDRDAAVVERVLAAGARVTAKLNMDALGAGATGETSAYGATVNPFDGARSAGGSSGGCGAAVASGMVELALGGDQGGSARIPAAYCGVAALLPTYARVSTHGMTHLDHSFDFICPMARTVRDVGLLLDVISGPDWRSPQTWDGGNVEAAVTQAPVPSTEMTGLRIGVIEESMPADHCDEEVRQNLSAVCTALEAVGASVERVSLPEWSYALDLTQSLVCQGAGGLFKSEGTGTGHAGLLDAARTRRFSVLRRRADLLPPYAKVWLLMERYLRVRCGNQPFVWLNNLRLAFASKLGQVLTAHDVLMTPTTLTTAPLMLGDRPDPTAVVARVLDSIPYNTAPLNLAGMPALAVPSGMNTIGLPMSVQIIGRRWEDALVLRVGEAVERQVELLGAPAVD